MVSRALEAGVQGYIEKTTPPTGIIEAVNAVLAGDVYLLRDIAQSLAPADWLIYKVYGVDPAEYAGREEIRALLLKLNSHYTESTRMLANRTMQTFKMLAENDLSIELERFLADFATIPSEGTMTVYGSYCQHYFNLRAQGMPHEAAVQNIIAERLRANSR